MSIIFLQKNFIYKGKLSMPPEDISEFQPFRLFIHQEFGVFYEQTNELIFIKRIKERMKILSIQSSKEYYQLITQNKTELQKLIDSITNNFTFFFRNDAQLHIFQTAILPQIEKKNQISKKIKIWSAGCSTGEEPYSIGMILARFFQKELHYWDISVLASDISLKALLKAREALYIKKKFVNTDPYYIQNFMEDHGNFYKIKKEIRKLIQLDFHNLMHENHKTNFDIIFCRNVFIYFDQKTQSQLIQKFYNKLNPGGYLFLGASEFSLSLKTPFILQNFEQTFVYYKPLQGNEYGEN